VRSPILPGQGTFSADGQPFNGLPGRWIEAKWDYSSCARVEKRSSASIKPGPPTKDLTVPVSAGLLTDLAGYFAAPTHYRAGDPQPIVALMAEASFSAIDDGRYLVNDLRGTRAAWNERIRIH
jgi:hypothetical protein